jgi:hypothetical protein
MKSDILMAQEMDVVSWAFICLVHHFVVVVVVCEHCHGLCTKKTNCNNN